MQKSKIKIKIIRIGDPTGARVDGLRLDNPRGPTIARGHRPKKMR